MDGSSSLADAVAARPPRLGRFRAATCDRWGDVAVLTKAVRAEAPRWYCARVRRRALRDRFPPLPLRASASVRVRAASAVRCVALAAACPRAGSPSPEVLVKPVPPAKRPRLAVSSRMAVGVLSVCPSLIAKAEARAAPALFDDFTDGGAVRVERYVQRFAWSSSVRAEHASTMARALDLLPRERSPPAWAALVCMLAALYLEELNPQFNAVRRRAIGRDILFSAVPLRGRFGWRARARWAGLVDAGDDSSEDLQ